MILWRKLLRDLRRHPGQAMALSLVFVLGIGAFVGLRIAYEGLEPATEALYARRGLPDLVARVTFAPARVVPDLEAIPGVAVVVPRIALETTVQELPGVRVRVLSLPAPERPRLGDVEVVAGRYLSGAPDEVLVVEGMARYHGLGVGDRLQLRTRKGGYRTFRVVGVVRQPEHLSLIPPGGFMALPRVYGVVLVGETAARSLLGRQGGYTEFALALEPGTDEAVVVRAVEQVLDRYRLELVWGRSLPSVRNVQAHIDFLRQSARIFPAFFLVAGALGGFILLSRVVRQERGIAGLMRALGYAPGTVMRHYLGYTLILAVVGGGLGILLGLPIARVVRELLAWDLGLPPDGVVEGRAAILLGGVFAVLAGLAAGVGPAWMASRVPPAAVMREEPPWGARTVRWLRRVPGGVWVRMAVRNLLRHPMRTLWTAVGVAFAVGLALAPALLLEEMDRVEARVEQVRRYDFRLVPTFPQPERWLEEVARVPGVQRVEGVVEVPVRLRIGEEEVRTYALGFSEDARLFDLPVPPPGEAYLAQGLPQTAEVVEVRGPYARLQLRVAGSVDYPLGRPVVLNLEDARRLLIPFEGVGNLFRLFFGVDLEVLEDPVTSVLVAVEPALREEVRARLSALEAVGQVDDRVLEREDLSRIFSASRLFVWVVEIFALLLALSLLYNTVMINGLERRKELAMLRVLGVRVREIVGLFMGEAFAIALLGIVLGMPAGLWVARRSLGDFQEFLPGGIGLYPGVVALVIGGAVVVVVLASLPVLRGLFRWSLAEVVRQRD